VSAQDNLLRRLFRPKHDYLPGTEVFRAVNIDEAADRLDLVRNGDADGQSESPATNSTQATPTERAIERYVEGKWQESLATAARAMDVLDTRWSSHTPGTSIEVLQAGADRVAGELAETARQHHSALDPFYAKFRDARDHLAAWRSAEGIDRPCRVDGAPALKFGGLIVAAGLELAINASYFAGGDEFGIAGALTKVLAIPALNVGVAWGLTRTLVRQLERRSWAWKIVGGMGLGLLILWIFGFNLLVAHTRDALATAMWEQAQRLALHATFSSTFELAGVESWMLFGIGVVAGIVGAADAWLWDDPHPGYARRVRAEQAARDAFEDERADFVDELGTLADGEIGRLTDARSEAEKGMTARAEIEARRGALAQDVRLYGPYLQTVAEDLFAIYREANQKSRTTPAPPRFARPSDLALDIPPFREPPIGMGRDYSGFLTSAIQRISKAKVEALARLPTLVEWSRNETQT
jgi:hypothetical protein